MKTLFDQERTKRKGNYRSGTLRHGQARRGKWTREYLAWTEMHKRCCTPSYKDYQYYGGRGISVCERWKLFENFLSDMGTKPSPTHSIDRINGDLGYTPENCRWATPIQQARNRRGLKVVTYQGKTGCLTEMAEIFNIPYYRLRSRLQRGWTIEAAFEREKVSYANDIRRRA
jgi:hypothetical protein